MNNIEVNAYIEFMYNPSNSHNCSECPENKGASSWGGNKPCGQQNCWVDVHCEYNDMNRCGDNE